jgi:phosphoglycerate kinase
VLATDVIVADAFKADANTQTVSADAIPDGWMGLDIGPDSVKMVEQVIRESKTVFWNGPMGVFEMPAFAKGTQTVAETLADVTGKGQCQSVLGGGDTVAALEVFHIDHKRYTHVSTGGGASLEFMEGRELPGIAALDDAPVTPVRLFNRV